MSDQQSGLVKIGALWRGKEGGAAFTGELGREAKLIVLSNKYKEPGDKRPDYNVFVARKDGDRGQGTAQQAPPTSAYEDDDIAF